MLKLLALDRFTILLFVMVLLASVLPVSGQAAELLAGSRQQPLPSCFSCMVPSFRVKL